MGPHYSALGAAQAVVRAGAEGKIVAVTDIAPGSEYNSTGVEALAAEEGLDYEAVFLETPISDADTVDPRHRQQGRRGRWRHARRSRHRR